MADKVTAAPATQAVRERIAREAYKAWNDEPPAAAERKEGVDE